MDEQANQPPDQPGQPSIRPRHNKAEPVVEDRAMRPYPTRTLDPPIRLVDRAREIEEAETSLQTSVNGKLELILEQIRNLQAQAREIIDQAHDDLELHKVTCNFEKKAGQVIHLYRRENGRRYFSLLSPEEWGTPPHSFEGSYRLTAERGFKRIDQ